MVKTSREIDIKEEDTMRPEGGEHDMENIGTTKNCGIIVEFK